jgi:hypothetical protein
MRRISIGKFARDGPNSPGVSRRGFVGIGAAAAGLTLSSGLWTPARGDPGGGEPSPGAPDPIPHTFIPPPAPCARAHFFFPGHADGSASDTDPTGVHPSGRDPSTLFNFDGVLGEADLFLTGMGTDTTTGATAPYRFHTDMRFMAGRFLGTDGRVHKGAFAFI